MNVLPIKVKRLYPDAKLPTQAYLGDAGWDLYAHSYNLIDRYIEYKTGIALEIPLNYVGLIFPRSSVSEKNLILANCVGVIDSGYRGEITLRYKLLSPPGEHIAEKLLEYPAIYGGRDKIGQLVVVAYSHLVIEEVNFLTESPRGIGGYGSSGQ